mmetsp:Transcript_17018/g.30745  ORF Transcript_17018/g.30745 Transcript_17018/m.30745 type:complete len:137 (+) Transcript_17018:92-502(+)
MCLASGRHGWIAAACGTLPPIGALIYLWITEGLAWYFTCPVIIILMVVAGAVLLKSQLSEVRLDRPAQVPTVTLVQTCSTTVVTGRPSVTSYHSQGEFDEENVISAPTVVAAQVRDTKLVQAMYKHDSPWANGFGA